MRTLALSLAAGIGLLLLAQHGARGGARRIPTALPRIEASLGGFLAGRPHAGPGSGLPVSGEGETASAFHVAVEAAAAWRFAAAAEAAGLAGYELSLLEDERRRYLVLGETSGAGAGPTVVISLDPARDLIVQAPHSASEDGTALQAAAFLARLGARAAILEGAHRCASAEPSGCDGTTGVCGSQGPFRSSDVAHARDSLFQIAHEALAEAYPDAVVVQLHRMRPGATLAVLSDGSPAGSGGAEGTGLIGRLRDRLRLELAAGDAAAVSCQDPADDVFAYPRLCGTTNVQGRHLAGSADACTELGPAPSGRFVHVEQAPSLLAGAEPGDAVVSALALELPCFAPGAEGCSPAIVGADVGLDSVGPDDVVRGGCGAP